MASQKNEEPLRLAEIHEMVFSCPAHSVLMVATSGSASSSFLTGWCGLLFIDGKDAKIVEVHVLDPININVCESNPFILSLFIMVFTL